MGSSSEASRCSEVIQRGSGSRKVHRGTIGYVCFEFYCAQSRHSFAFSILLPATLATRDDHEFGRVSHIITARVDGIPSSSSTITNMFRKEVSTIGPCILHKEDFEAVIARSHKRAQDVAVYRTNPRMVGSFSNALGSPTDRPALTSDTTAQDDSAIDVGQRSPTLTGLYHRRQSAHEHNMPSISLDASSLRTDQQTIRAIQSASQQHPSLRSEKSGWLKGDLWATRNLIIHANPSRTGGVTQLDLRTEGSVTGLNAWRFSATADVVRKSTKQQQTYSTTLY